MRAGFLVSLFLVLFDQGLDFLPLGTLLELMLAITSHTWKHFLAIATLSSLHPLGVGNGEYCRLVLCMFKLYAVFGGSSGYLMAQLQRCKLVAFALGTIQTL